MGKSQAKIDEFAFILLAGLLFIIILTVAWTSLPKPFVEVEPEFISLIVARGSSSRAVIYLNGSANNVTLKARGDIANWVRFSKNNFTLAGEIEVSVIFSIPSTVEIRTYSGSIEIEFDGEKKSIPVSLDIVEREAETYKTFELGDFSISYYSGKEIIASKSDFEVVRGYFTDFPSTLVFSLEKLYNLKNGLISLIVEQTNSAGNLIVKFNDKVVFNEKVGEGEIKIPIEKSEIKNYNTLKIEAGLPGWKFWMNTVYKIKQLSFEAEYEGMKFKEYTFSLKRDDVGRYKWGRLTFQIKNKTGEGNLVVKLNDREIYNAVPPAPIGGYFGFYLGDVELNTTNKVYFYTEKYSSYELQKVVLTLVFSAY